MCLKKVKQYSNTGRFEGYYERLVKVAVKHQHDQGFEGSLLMDAPTNDCQTLQKMAEDKPTWKKMLKKLKPPKQWTDEKIKTAEGVDGDDDSSEVDYSPAPGEHAEPNWDISSQQLITQLQNQFPLEQSQLQQLSDIPELQAELKQHYGPRPQQSKQKQHTQYIPTIHRQKTYTQYIRTIYTQNAYKKNIHTIHVHDVTKHNHRRSTNKKERQKEEEEEEEEEEETTSSWRW